MLPVVVVWTAMAALRYVMYFWFYGWCHIFLWRHDATIAASLQCWVQANTHCSVVLVMSCRKDGECPLFPFSTPLVAFTISILGNFGVSSLVLPTFQTKVTPMQTKPHYKKMWSHESTITMFIINITITDCELVLNVISSIHELSRCRPRRSTCGTQTSWWDCLYSSREWIRLSENCLGDTGIRPHLWPLGVHHASIKCWSILNLTFFWTLLERCSNSFSCCCSCSRCFQRKRVSSISYVIL